MQAVGPCAETPSAACAARDARRSPAQSSARNQRECGKQRGRGRGGPGRGGRNAGSRASVKE